jgi:4-hydroxybenzoate polyprenyltransferase
MFKNYFTLLRIPQWVKNFFVFVPLLFSLNLFKSNYFIKTFEGFFIFCLASSIIYIINDIGDIKEDRLHPVKKLRPLASGAVSVRTAVITVFILTVPVIILLTQLNARFVTIVLAFFVLNVLYTFSFKHIVLLDIFSIAAGFMLRVVGGAFIINVEISSWLILTTMFLSLFLASMKRHSELRLGVNDENKTTRKVLSEYSTQFTRQMSTVSSSAVIISYALYTVSQRTVSIFGNENLIFTTPFVVFGIFRYMYLVYMNDKGENTTQIMLTDIPMIITVFSYILVAVFIIYDIL